MNFKTLRHKFSIYGFDVVHWVTDGQQTCKNTANNSWKLFFCYRTNLGSGELPKIGWLNDYCYCYRYYDCCQWFSEELDQNSIYIH